MGEVGVGKKRKEKKSRAAGNEIREDKIIKGR